MDSKWILTLDKLSTQKTRFVKSMEKDPNFSICRYTIISPKRTVLLSFYSKDGFKTIDHAELYNPQSRKLTVFEIKKAIPETSFKLVLSKLKSMPLTPKNIKTLIQSLKTKKENAVITEGMNTETLLMYLTIGMYVLSVIFLLIAFAKYMKLVTVEATVDAYEKKLTKDMFAMQTGDEPEFEVYADLIHYVESICRKDTLVNGLIVYGPPGTGKTYIVKRTLYFNKAKYIVLKGATMSAMDVYSALYQNNGRIIVLDDFDITWTEEYLGLLKAATDTQKKRIISFPQTATVGQQGERYDIPKAFIFTGKVILLTNKDRKDIPAALTSRCPTIEVAFNVEKMIQIVQKMLKFIHPEIDMSVKEEVMKFLLKLYANKQLKYIDFRTIEIGISIRQAFPDEWKSMLVKNLVVNK